jgi:hypothetical protein
MDACPYCDRPLAGDICLLHGYVGKKKDEDFGRVPVGGIIMYSGSSTLIPSGWKLCDGTNGTPDLRDKFVVGAGSTYAVGGTGGSNAAHSHSVSMSSSGTATGTIGNASLSAHTGTAVSNHSDHVHALGTPVTGGPSATQTKKEGTGSDMSVPTPGHTHTLSSGNYTDYVYNSPALSHTVTQPSDHDQHSHTFSSGSASVSGSATSGTASSMPAYYALALIMRVK